MFNILNDKWIKATGKDGSIEEYGIRELLEKAPKLEGITDESPLIEYGLYRFLFVFLMDAYQLKDEFDLGDLLESGKFDSETIEEYIELCEKEDVSFDIFNRENPFLQEVVPESEWNIKNAAVLNPLIPTATSRTFFNHGFDTTRSLTKAEIARALPSTTLFPRGGTGYRTCISGEGLVFNIIAGNNLFETLVYGMIPKRHAKGMEYGKPYWRDKGFTTAESKVDTSLLFGLTFPIRQVYIPEEKENIRDIHFSRGMSPDIEHWRDPYVAYLPTKDGKKVPMHATQDSSTGILKDQWRNIATIARRGDGIAILENVEDKKTIRIVSYAIYVNNAIQDINRGEFILPTDVYYNERKNEVLEDSIKKSELVAYLLKTAMHKTFNKGKSTVADSVIKDCIFRYYEKCGSLFEEQLTRDFDGSEWTNKVGDIALEEFDNFMDRFCVSAGRIKESVTQRNALCAGMMGDKLKIKWVPKGVRNKCGGQKPANGNINL